MSSTETDGAEAPAEAAVTEGAATSESPAEKSGAPSLLDAVSAALDGKNAESPPAEHGKDGTDPSDPDKTAESAEEAKKHPDGTTKYPKTFDGRIRQLTDRNKDLETRLSAAEGFKAKAEQLDQILGHLAGAKVKPEEMDALFDAAGKIKRGDYEGALKFFAPIVQKLHQRAGNILPDDLTQRVRKGEITQKDALELHRNRTKATNAEERQRQTAQDTERAQREEHVRTIAQNASDAVSAWDLAKAKSDPDWSQKQPLVGEMVELELNRRFRQNGFAGYPQTKADAVALAEAALKKVEERLKKFVPRPTERRMPIGESPSPRSQAKPKSILEAIDLGLAQAGA